MPTSARAPRTSAEQAPQSWSISSWPASVFPHAPLKATYLVRANKKALIEAGALRRVGRVIVIIGYAYVRWLDKQQYGDFHGGAARSARKARS